MYQIEHFELNTTRAIAFHLKTDCVIRVTTGRLWLTVQGRPSDVWLQAGEDWIMPVNGTLWLSAEPQAVLQIAQPIAVRATYRQKNTRPYWLASACKYELYLMLW